MADEDFDLVDRTKRTICVELRRPSIIEALTPNVSGIQYPETYFKAVCEVITIMLGGSMIITLLFNRSVIMNNPLNDRIGYPNLCVFFDTYPAKYYAVICWGFVIYLGCKFAWLDIERTLLVRNRLSCFKVGFSIVTDILFMGSVILFSFVFVIPPTEGVWKHSWTFIVLIFVIYLVVLANILEAQNAPVFCYIWMVLYGITAICDVTFICGNFLYYDKYGVGPLFPVWLGFIMDYGWFTFTPLCTLFLPNAEGIRKVATVVEVDELTYGENDQTIGCCSGDFDDEEDEELVSP